MTRDDFLEFMFGDLKPNKKTDKYIEIERVNENKTKIVVRVADRMIFKTRYGYGLACNKHEVLWLKPFQVNINYYGNEVMLRKSSFFPQTTTKEFLHAVDSGNNLWQDWLTVAENQQSLLILDEYTGEMVRKYPCYWRLY